MTNRRNFLQQSGALALASLIYPGLGKASNLFPTRANKAIGLQLYTVAGFMETDPKGTLQKLAAIGYKELESAGSSKGNYYGYTPNQFAAMVKDMGMTWRSEHVGGFPLSMSEIMKFARNAEDSAKIQKMAPMIEGMAKMPNLQKNTQQLADEAAEGGLSYMICSGVPVDTMDAVKSAVDLLNKAGEACKKVGVQFGYHNHYFEFNPVNGVVPFDYFMANTDKNLVKFELDLGWATVAGKDPVDIFKKYSGRIPLWHVKDVNKSTLTPVAMGTGNVDFKRLFTNSEVSGMKYFFVEEEDAQKPLELVANDYAFIKKIIA
jgi:sugar phosphate isomerase/epimerase